jgi:hypothetical protein
VSFASFEEGRIIVGAWFDIKTSAMQTLQLYRAAAVMRKAR